MPLQLTRRGTRCLPHCKAIIYLNQKLPKSNTRNGPEDPISSYGQKGPSCHRNNQPLQLICFTPTRLKHTGPNILQQEGQKAPSRHQRPNPRRDPLYQGELQYLIKTFQDQPTTQALPRRQTCLPRKRQRRKYIIQF